MEKISGSRDSFVRPPQWITAASRYDERRSMALRNYAMAGWLLVALFAGRVIAQPLSLVVSRFPTLESWHSAALPYWLLLVSQLAILAILSSATYRVTIGAINPGRRFGGTSIHLLLSRPSLGARHRPTPNSEPLFATWPCCPAPFSSLDSDRTAC